MYEELVNKFAIKGVHSGHLDTAREVLKQLVTSLLKKDGGCRFFRRSGKVIFELGALQDIYFVCQTKGGDGS